MPKTLEGHTAAPATDAALLLKPEQITVTFDHIHREVVVIPDEIARAMQAEIKSGWTELLGWGYGHSRDYEPGHWMYENAQMLFRAYADSPVPAEFNERDSEQARGSRLWAGGEWPRLYALVVGASDWDAGARYWVDYRANFDLHLSGSAHTMSTEGGKGKVVQISG